MVRYFLFFRVLFDLSVSSNIFTFTTHTAAAGAGVGNGNINSLRFFGDVITRAIRGNLNNLRGRGGKIMVSANDYYRIRFFGFEGEGKGEGVLADPISISITITNPQVQVLEKIIFGTSFGRVQLLVGSSALPEFFFEGQAQIIAFISWLELSIGFSAATIGGGGSLPTPTTFVNFSWAAFEETKFQKLAIALNQGRAAMNYILGLAVHEQLGGSIPIVGEL